MMASAEFWFLMLSFAVLMYVILDGFDLGLGILFPWFEDDRARAKMMTSIAHVWDGNETWLVFGGVILFAAFPSVYALLLSAAYLPVIIMLLALVMRGAAFEYRFKSTTSTRWWDRAFGYGSSVAAFCQGFILGNVVTGDFDLNLFSVLTGFAVMAGYALLACGWMVIKKTGDIQIKAAQLGKKLTIILLGGFIMVSLYSLYLNPELWQRWFAWPDFVYLLPLPLLAVALSVWQYLHFNYLIETLDKGQTDLAIRVPFVLTIAFFALGFIGLWVGMHPYLVPGEVTMHEALAPQSSLAFISPGVIILVPVILAYTAYGYKVFGGKVENTQPDY